MKNIFIFFFIVLNKGIAQNLQVKSIWHYQKGDVKWGGKNRLDLKYNELVNIEFQGSYLSNSEFQYRILNADIFSKWIYLGHEPRIQMPLLSGGKYQLELSKINAPKIILARLNVIVEKPFWQLWWFYPAIIAYFILIIGMAFYLFFLYNFRQKLKLSAIRHQIAADLHDEVGSNLNSIAIFVELLKRNSRPKDLPIIEKILANTTESVGLMQDTVWAINPKNDNIQNLFEKIRANASTILSSKNIAFDFNNSVTHQIQFTMDQRKNVYLIIKEAVNNIAKHSNASKASINIFETPQKHIVIDIEDNGVGFDTNETFEGNGLINYRARAEESDINVKIASEINKGTKISITV